MASPLCPFSLAFYMDDQTKKGVIIWYIVQRIIIIIHTPLTIFLPHATPNKQIFCNMKQPPLTNVPTNCTKSVNKPKSKWSAFSDLPSFGILFPSTEKQTKFSKGKVSISYFFYFIPHSHPPLCCSSFSQTKEVQTSLTAFLLVSPISKGRNETDCAPGKKKTRHIKKSSCCFKPVSTRIQGNAKMEMCDFLPLRARY